VLAPQVGNVTPVEPATASGRTLSNEHLRAEVGEDGRIDLTHLATGTTFRGVLALRDGGDAGDEYNYSPPERDLIIEGGEILDVSVVREGPLEARLGVAMRMTIPSALATDRRRRARKTVATPVTLELSLRTGEPFLRATFRVTNAARDHRLRVHVPLPFTAAASHADGAFDVVERGLVAEGGFEAPLATYPCRRFVDASDGAAGIAVLHRGTPEYELIDGRELAVTLLRCVGWLSRQDLATRSGPAGPALETPGAQLPGDHTFRLALYPHAGDWLAGGVERAAELFALPLRGAGARRHTGDLPAAGGALGIEPASVQMSALTAVDGRIECRVFNVAAEPVPARIVARWPLDLRSPAKIGLYGDELERLEVDDGAIALPLRAHEIATVRLA
jgi:alpha-mannosidase